MAKTALITGITGQDGAYLAELLLKKGYVVHGIKRRTSLFNTQRIDHLYQDRHEADAKLFLHYGDLSDSCNLVRIVQETQPHEIYNLGAMSHVHVSFDEPEYVANVDGIGSLRLLDAVRLLKLQDKTKIYQASTSELYGKTKTIPQNETTPFSPRSPYAAAKLYAYWITVNYREAYGMFASNGILFNHESPIRGETFVTRKITRAAAMIAMNLQEKLYLGNLNAMRDWGHAKDYVRAMHMILQHDKADDFVIATGVAHSVRTFVEKSFSELGLQLEFRGSGNNEKGYLAAIDESKFEEKVGFHSDHLIEGRCLIEVKPEYFRPTEVEYLLGDATKARKLLGWEPEHTLDQLIAEMVNADVASLRKNKILFSHGFNKTEALQRMY